MHPPVSGIVTLLTDFGQFDPYVGIMHGMIRREHRRVDVVDLCHGVPPQNLVVAGLFARSAVGRFPSGTVHVAVVDPGVGTSRRVVGLVAHDCYWFAPDNGLLTSLFPAASEVREVDARSIDLEPESHTFHGRDLFAPLAGRLSSGRYGFRSVGPKLTEPVVASTPEGHRVVHVDRFGNLITDVTASELALSGSSSVRVSGVVVPVSCTYADVAEGEPLALVNSFDLVEIAVHAGDARLVLGVDVGESVALT